MYAVAVIDYSALLDRTKSSLDLTNCKQQLDSDLSRVHSASQSSLAHHQALQSYNGTDDCYDLAASPRYDQVCLACR